ncbi:hypothetical protein C3L33_13928, partial [Rhododendron williamsianum]
MSASREGHYRGVRERPCGRYATEIRDRWKKTRVWLGTFDTPDGAARSLPGAKAKTNFIHSSSVSAVLAAATAAGGDDLGAAEGGAPRVSEQGKQRRGPSVGFLLPAAWLGT